MDHRAQVVHKEALALLSLKGAFGTSAAQAYHMISLNIEGPVDFGKICII